MDRETAAYIRGLAARAVVSAIADDGKAQGVTVETHDGVTRSDIEVMQPFGLASRAPDGAITVVLAIGGDQGDMVALAPSCPSARFGKLQPGEAVLYNADGDRVHIKLGGVIAIQANTKVQIQAPEVEITAPTVTINGDVTLNGKLTATGEIQSGTIKLTAHKHTGVTPGVGNSGGPVA